MADVTRAAGNQDLPALEMLTRHASELKQMKEQVAAIDARLQAMENGKGPPITSRSRSGSSSRELAIEVTQGMINQNLLTLTRHVKRGSIRIGESLDVEAVPSGERFTTQLLSAGNKLQERGAMARFYRDAGIHAGDVVVLAEITPGHWQLKKGAGTAP